MNPWLIALLGAIAGFLLGFLFLGRVDEDTYQAKLRADYYYLKLIAAEKRIEELERAG